MTPSARPRPTERTYEPGDALPDLARLPGVREVVEVPADAHTETFFDTRTLALARAGVSLSRRVGGADEGWVLVLPSRRRRDEVRVPLARSRWVPPATLRTTVTAWSLGDELVAAAEVDDSGTTYELVGAERAVLAVVTVRDARAEVTARDGGTVTWRDVAVEPVGAEAALVHAVDVAMDDAGASRTIRRTGGLELLQRLLLETPPLPAPRPKRASGRVLHLRLTEQALELKRLDAEARHDVDVGVHNLRVALRRLAAALGTWRPLVDARVTDPVRDELTWAARALGGPRDEEVADELLAGMLADQPSDLVVGPVRRRLGAELRGSRRTMRRQTLEVLESQRYVDLLRSLDDLVADPPWTDVAARPAREALPRLLRKDWTRVVRRARHAESLAGTPAHDAALHDVRKAAKRLRYAAESLEPVFGSEATRLVGRARKVQSVLGQHHDSVVARARLVALAEAAQQAGESAFTYGRLHAMLEARGRDFARAGERAARRVPKPRL